jgi:hypothetical protein
LVLVLLRWHPRFVIGLLALPLCGAAVTFFAAAKKVTKESSFQPPVPVRQALLHTAFELSHHTREHSGVRPKSGEGGAKDYTPFADMRPSTPREHPSSGSV